MGACFSAPGDRKGALASPKHLQLQLARPKGTTDFQEPYVSEHVFRQKPSSVFQKNSPGSTGRSGSDLAKVIAFWKDDSRMQHMSIEELEERLFADHRVLIRALDDVNEELEHTKCLRYEKSSTSSPRLRVKSAAAKHNTEKLSPGTPRAIDRLAKINASGGVSLPTAHPRPSELAGKDSAFDDTIHLDFGFPSEGSVSSKSHHLVTGDLLGEQIAQDYRESRMLMARSKLLKWCEANHKKPSDPATSEVLGFDTGELLSHCVQIDKILEAIRDESDYKVAKQDNDLRVLHKCTDGKVHYIKMEAVFPHNLEELLALAREFDLVSTWNHYVMDSSLLAVPSIWESYVYGGLWMPFPFPQMDTLAKGRGYDLSLEEHSLIISLQSVEESQLPPGAKSLPASAKKRKRATVLPGSIIRLEAVPPGPDGKPKTKGCMLVVVDPHLPSVPNFIVNFVLGVVAPFAHRQMLRLLTQEFSDPSKPYPRRMAANPELYNRVRKAVAERLEQLQRGEIS